jgi:hypothetical protein
MIELGQLLNFLDFAVLIVMYWHYYCAQNGLTP